MKNNNKGNLLVKSTRGMYRKWYGKDSYFLEVYSQIKSSQNFMEYLEEYSKQKQPEKESVSKKYN